MATVKEKVRSKTTTQLNAPQFTKASIVTEETRRLMIAERAYYRAEHRGDEGGDPIADWLAAESEVDAILGRRS